MSRLELYFLKCRKKKVAHTHAKILLASARHCTYLIDKSTKAFIEALAREYRELHLPQLSVTLRGRLYRPMAQGLLTSCTTHFRLLICDGGGCATGT